MEVYKEDTYLMDLLSRGFNAEVGEIKSNKIPMKSPHPVPLEKKQYGSRASNRERSGTRDLTLSTQLRNVGISPESSDNIRHKDNDFSQHCSKCSKAYIFIEGSTDSSKASTYIRAMAEDVKHKAWAVRIIHYPNDMEGTKGVKEIHIWENGRKLLDHQKDIPWSKVIKGLEIVHKWHVDSFSCKKREAFK